MASYKIPIPTVKYQLTIMQRPITANYVQSKKKNMFKEKEEEKELKECV